MHQLVTMTISPTEKSWALEDVFRLIEKQFGVTPKVVAQGEVRPGMVVDGVFIAVPVPSQPVAVWG